MASAAFHQLHPRPWCFGKIKCVSILLSYRKECSWNTHGARLATFVTFSAALSLAVSLNVVGVLQTPLEKMEWQIMRLIKWMLCTACLAHAQLDSRTPLESLNDVAGVFADVPITVEAANIKREASEVASSVMDVEARDTLRVAEKEAHLRDLRDRVSSAKRLIAKIKLAADKAVQAERIAKIHSEQNEQTQLGSIGEEPGDSTVGSSGTLAKIQQLSKRRAQNDRLKALKEEEEKDTAELHRLKAKLARASTAIEQVKAATAEVRHLSQMASRTTTSSITHSNYPPSKASVSDHAPTAQISHLKVPPKSEATQSISKLQVSREELQQMVLKLEADKKLEEKAKAIEENAHRAVLTDLHRLEEMERSFA